MKSNIKISNRQLQALYREDLSSFTQMAFKTLEPNSKYHHSAHIDLIADRLTQSYDGDIKNLIINMPPRMMKSLSTSVAYPAWILGKAPQTKIMCVSYSEDLARDLSMKTQKLMSSSFYKTLFPNTVVSNSRQTQLEYFTTKGGGRYAVSTGGAIAGFGADIIIIDDPIKPSDANSKKLENCNRWFTENIYQRLNNKNTGSIIVVMQRVHENDLTGFLLEKQKSWQHLSLPAIAENNECYKLKSGGAYKRDIGEALHPERESIEQLATVKVDLGSYIFAGQYQQSPAPAEGGIVKQKWFNYYTQKDLPYSEFNMIVQSWDTAITDNDSSDYSVGMTIGYIDKGDAGDYYILDIVREKMEFPELLTTIEKFHKDHRYSNIKTNIVVEDAGSGKAVIQSLWNRNIDINTFKPETDKRTRLISITSLIESGFIYLPEKAPWLEDFVLEVTRFPKAKHDDQVDAFTQGISWLRDAYQHTIRVVQISGF